MRHIVLTSGPRGSGKSTYCKRHIVQHRHIDYISRDDIFDELFGHEWANPYTGLMHVGMELLWKLIGFTLEDPNTTIIFDCWNGFPDERAYIVRKLRELGAEYIEVWQFTTPIETCVDWFCAREDAQASGSKSFIDTWRANSCRRDYNLYHEQDWSQAPGIDHITFINPLQTVLHL